MSSRSFWLRSPLVSVLACTLVSCATRGKAPDVAPVPPKVSDVASSTKARDVWVVHLAEPKYGRARVAPGLSDVDADAPAPAPTTAVFPDSKDVSLTLYFGCTQAPPFTEPDACLPAFDTVGRCAPRVPDYLSEADGPTGLTQEEMDAKNEELRLNHEQETEEWDGESSALKDRTWELREKYPSGPWVHLSIAGSRERHAAGMRVFVYSFEFNIRSTCIEFAKRIDDPTFSAESRLWPDEGETLDVWMTGGSYESSISGVVAAEDQEAARGLILKKVRKYPELFSEIVPPSSIVGPWHDCGGCYR